jgi:nucleoside-diphosphate-sugar epimerase
MADLTRLVATEVLVTGGAGFIGSHLVDALLAAGARVRVLDDLSTGDAANLAHVRDRIVFVQGDIRDAATCRKACEGVRYVFHQAALGSVPRSLADPAASIAVNVAGTANVFAAARDAHVQRIVYASSSSVYGDSPEQPRREGAEGRPLSPYALSKRMNEELAETFGRCFEMELVGLRYFNVYGPRQRPDGPYAAVVPRFFHACVAGVSPVIYGDGTQSRDFTFVADAARANVLAALAPASACGRAYNVGSGRSTSVRELLRLVGQAAGACGEPAYEPARSGDVRDSRADLSLVSFNVGYAPEVDLAAGLESAAPAYREPRGQALAGDRAGVR